MLHIGYVNRSGLLNNSTYFTRASLHMTLIESGALHDNLVFFRERAQNNTRGTLVLPGNYYNFVSFFNFHNLNVIPIYECMRMLRIEFAFVFLFVSFVFIRILFVLNDFGCERHDRVPPH